MNTYFAYGLGIYSEITLPGRAPVSAEEDVTIRVGRVDCPFAETSERTIVQTSGNEAIAFQYWAGAARIRDGKEIIVDARADTDPVELRMFLLGPVFATLLHQRGDLVLHASSVNIRGHSVAFLAEPGGGKSTTAAAFLARGYPLVTDDILAVSLEDMRVPMTRPAFPFFKIRPDAAEALGDDLLTEPRVSDRLDKRVQVTPNFSRAADSLLFVRGVGGRNTRDRAADPAGSIRRTGSPHFCHSHS